jgi:DNA-binding MarR family transcriptional regulator
LSRAVGRAWRRLRRRTGKELGDDARPELEVELLRLTAVRPGLRVSEAAAELGLAPNTVSTVVTRLVEGGLLERERDEADHRAVRLSLTAAGKRRRATRRDIRRSVMASALERLSDEDRRTLFGAMPALARLVEELGR